MSDQREGTDTAAVEIAIAPAPDAPVAVGSIAVETLDVGGAPSRTDLAPNFSDADGDELRYSATATWPVTAAVTGSVLSLGAVAPGSGTVTATATDPSGRSASHEFTVTTRDDAARDAVADTIAAIGRGQLASARATLGRRVSAGREERKIVIAGMDVPLTREAAGASARSTAENWLLQMAGAGTYAGAGSELTGGSQPGLQPHPSATGVGEASGWSLGTGQGMTPAAMGGRAG